MEAIGTIRKWSYEAFLEELRFQDICMEAAAELGTQYGIDVVCGEEDGKKYWDITIRK